jgi:hypothetical protein
MSWAELHQRSEHLAAEAQAASRDSGDRAQALYAQAAGLEAEAIAALPPSKTRTIGITAVSAVALWFKAKEFDQA